MLPLWISEIMLQQTRVRAVLPYYQRFWHASNARRARGPAGHRAALVAGLGYYSRAPTCIAPQKKSWTAWREFPDASRSIALPDRPLHGSAVLSIAYGEPHAVLGRNVARCWRAWRHSEICGAERWRELAAAANALLPRKPPPCGPLKRTGISDMELGRRCDGAGRSARVPWCAVPSPCLESRCACRAAPQA